MIIGSDILFFETLQSTNITAASLLKGREVNEGTVITTDFQTAGKGQHGNRWESERGKNLLFSIILYPGSVSPDEQFLLSMSVSLGICDFLMKYTEGVRIKWPNDVYAGDNKIAGILIESSIIGKVIESSVSGIGININQEKFPPDIPNPVSLKILTGKEHDTRMCLQQLLQELDMRYKQLLYGDRNLIRNDYFSLLYRAGEWHCFKSEGSIFKGMITGITKSGRLIIEQENNTLREFLFKEVDYIP